MYKIHFELRGDKVYKRIILMVLVIGFLSCNPASADNVIVNGDFDTDLTGWSTTGNVIHGASSELGNIAFMYGSGESTATLYQTINADNVNFLNFSYYYTEFPAISSPYFKVYVNSTCLFTRTSPTGWTQVSLDMSGYTGTKVIKFLLYVPTGTNMIHVGIDNIVAEVSPPPDYITWSTWPEDSWAVGNYSMITVGLPRPPDPVDFYIKTPSTDYIKKPLTKSPLVKTWNYEESQWYYQYFHTVYHSQYGDYSCKIVNSSADFIEYSNITVPYSSPDVPIPPVVTIPTPDPIKAPPEWNVTIPEQYENVSWIFDYTDFWDELGITLNDTLYSTVGLIFIPMESINESVYTVYTHVDTAADMVSGSEHTNVIVQVAWNVIPDSIKTIFIGAAAIGLCIFILHRRT